LIDFDELPVRKPMAQFKIGMKMIPSYLKRFPFSMLQWPVMALCVLVLLQLSSCSKTNEQPSNDYPSCKPLLQIYEGGEDGFQIFSFEFQESCLVFQLGYSGGCGEHTFDLVKEDGSDTVFPNFQEDVENIVSTYKIVHDDGDDRCQAYFSADVSFDLNSLQVGNTDRVYFRIKDVPGLLVYQY